MLSRYLVAYLVIRWLPLWAKPYLYMGQTGSDGFLRSASRVNNTTLLSPTHSFYLWRLFCLQWYRCETWHKVAFNIGICRYTAWSAITSCPQKACVNKIRGLRVLQSPLAPGSSDEGSRITQTKNLSLIHTREISQVRINPQLHLSD